MSEVAFGMFVLICTVGTHEPKCIETSHTLGVIPSCPQLEELHKLDSSVPVCHPIGKGNE